jgi:nucleoside-diphosphate-sugar epimerase
MRIAVTGATGFVGRALIRAGTEAGHEMIALSRSATAEGIDVPIRVVGDITDAAALERAFNRADAVVHLAARVHVMHHEGDEALERFRAVNVMGTRAVLGAARAAGARRIVVFSTAKVLGEGGDGQVLRDDAPLAPHGAYARSKAEMEDLIAASSTADWTIIRPPLVYGPGVGGNFRRLLRFAEIAAVVPVPLGGVRNARSLVHVGNLAHAALHVVGDDRARGRRYLVSDGDDLSTADLLRRLGDAMGRRVRLLSVPPAALRIALQAIGRGAEAERLLESFRVDSTAIRRDIGWSAPFTVSQGLADTVRWWKTHRATA